MTSIKRNSIRTRITVNVTEEVLGLAQRRDSKKCVLATALALSNSELRNISVTSETAAFSEDGYRYTFNIPANVAAKVVAYDVGKNLTPFRVVFQDPSVKLVRKVTRTWKRKTHVCPEQKKKRASYAKRVSRRHKGLKVIEVPKKDTDKPKKDK